MHHSVKETLPRGEAVAILKCKPRTFRTLNTILSAGCFIESNSNKFLTLRITRFSNTLCCYLFATTTQILQISTMLTYQYQIYISRKRRGRYYYGQHTGESRVTGGERGLNTNEHRRKARTAERSQSVYNGALDKDSVVAYSPYETG